MPLLTNALKDIKDQVQESKAKIEKAADVVSKGVEKAVESNPLTKPLANVAKPVVSVTNAIAEGVDKVVDSNPLTKPLTNITKPLVDVTDKVQDKILETVKEADKQEQNASGNKILFGLLDDQLNSMATNAHGQLEHKCDKTNTLDCIEKMSLTALVTAVFLNVVLHLTKQMNALVEKVPLAKKAMDMIKIALVKLGMIKIEPGKERRSLNRTFGPIKEGPLGLIGDGLDKLKPTKLIDGVTTRVKSRIGQMQSMDEFMKDPSGFVIRFLINMVPKVLHALFVEIPKAIVSSLLPALKPETPSTSIRKDK